MPARTKTVWMLTGHTDSSPETLILFLPTRAAVKRETRALEKKLYWVTETPLTYTLNRDGLSKALLMGALMAQHRDLQFPHVTPPQGEEQ
jgi:hypothetical protein